MKNLSIFEPQIEKHYAYKKTSICKRDLEVMCKENFKVSLAINFLQREPHCFR